MNKPPMSNKAMLRRSFTVGKIAAVASFPLTMMLAACCSGAMIEKGSFLFYVIMSIVGPGFYLSGLIDRSGGWTSVGVLASASFIQWFVLTFLFLKLRQRYKSQQIST